MVEIILTKRAVSSLEKIESKQAKRIVEKLH